MYSEVRDVRTIASKQEAFKNEFSLVVSQSASNEALIGLDTCHYVGVVIHPVTVRTRFCLFNGHSLLNPGF